MNTKILLATGNDQINQCISSKVRGNFYAYDTVAICKSREDIIEFLRRYEQSPCETVLLTNALRGNISLLEVMDQIKSRFPTMRVVYISTPVNMAEPSNKEFFAKLVAMRIYDIVIRQDLTLSVLQSILDTQIAYEDVKHFAAHLIKEDTQEQEFIEARKPEGYMPRKEESTGAKVISFGSIKPGLGKSTLACNTALGIAKYGVNAKGKQVRVCLLEADFQNLSVGSLLNIEMNQKYNVKTVLQEISKVVTASGSLANNPVEHKKVAEFIDKSLIPYNYCKNLRVLTGSELNIDELSDVSNEFYYAYLIDAVKKNFDVVIIDMNSSLEHVTTAGTISKSDKCYYILDLDFHAIMSNQNYLSVLDELKVSYKIKYVLNKDINEDNRIYAGCDLEEQEFKSKDLSDSVFKVETKIPLVPTVIMANRSFRGLPLVLDDAVTHTRKVKYAILELANQIWPIRGLEEMYKQIQNDTRKKRSFLGRK